MRAAERDGIGPRPDARSFPVRPGTALPLESLSDLKSDRSAQRIDFIMGIACGDLAFDERDAPIPVEQVLDGGRYLPALRQRIVAPAPEDVVRVQESGKADR